MSIEILRSKLANKRKWITERYNVYEMAYQPLDPSPIIPAKEKWAYNTRLGWCTKAVDDLANRLQFDRFDNDNYNIWEIFQLNSPDVLFDSAIRSALISACCFIYISVNDDDEVCLQVIDGKNATGEIDPITFLLKEGYAVLDTNELGEPITEAYFTPNETVFFYKNDNGHNHETHVANPTGYPLLVPVIYRPDASHRPFGQSRISRDMIDIQNHARNTITCMEVAREFGAFPQKYVVGLSQDAEFDTIKSAYKQVLAIDKDSDGDKPVVGQFNQLSLSSYLAQLQEYEKQFDKVAGLDSHEALEIIAVGAQKSFGTGFLNTGLVAASLRDEAHYKRNAIYATIPTWKPVYNIDNSVISTFGDGILKINQAIPDAINSDAIRRLTGLPVNG